MGPCRKRGALQDLDLKPKRLALFGKNVEWGSGHVQVTDSRLSA